MYINHRPEHFKSRHPHIEQAAKRHRLLLNLFGLALVVTIEAVVIGAALITGQL